MPPKAKFTKEEIVNAALDIVRKSGLDALTARELGNALGSSARPIFTVFKSMEEVFTSVSKAARALYNKYVEDGLSMTPSFKGFGIQSIRFAIDEPRLFQLLFMQELTTIPHSSEILGVIDEHYEEILSVIQNDFHIDYEQSQRLYFNMWVYVHGIATLCATNVCSFTMDEVSEMLGTAFRSFMLGISLPFDSHVKDMPSKGNVMPKDIDSYLFFKKED